MTKDNDFKDVVRARMAATGERYTQALAHLLAEDGRERAPSRIIGVERRYSAVQEASVTARLGSEEMMRYLFRRVVAWGRSTNVYLYNGSRLYLLPDGETAEYATPECDSARTATIHAFAGDRRVDDLVSSANGLLQSEGIQGEIAVTAGVGEQGGQHESYSVSGTVDHSMIAAGLVPFLVTRQIFAGPRREIQVGDRRVLVISPRAEHVWEAVGQSHAGGSHSRAIVDLNAPPHADPEAFHRLHLAVGDAHPSPAITFLTIGATSLVLRLLEEAPDEVPTSLALENPLRAIREISHDPSLHREIRLADGRQRATALRMQRAIFEAVAAFAHRHGTSNEERRVLRLWGRALDALEAGAGSFAPDDVVCTDKEVELAMEQAPQTTRARLRGEFIRACSTARRDYTVDWTHLKLNDTAQRTILLKDPFRSEDERVDRLIASIRVDQP